MMTRTVEVECLLREATLAVAASHQPFRGAMTLTALILCSYSMR